MESNVANHGVARMKVSHAEGRAPGALEGFTLSETMMALCIFGIMMAALMTVFSMSMRAWKEGGVDLSLQSSGRLIIEKIVRGPAGLFGLQEAGEGGVTVGSGGRSISFRVDKNNPPTFDKLDDTEVRIYLQDNKIMYDPSATLVGDEVPIISFGRVADVRFQANGSTVNIELWMSETSGMYHPSHVKFQTKVFLRKSHDPDAET